MWSPQKRHFCAKSIKNSRKQVKNGSFSAVFWSKWRDFQEDEYIHALRLTSELAELRSGYANPHSASQRLVFVLTTTKKRRQPQGLSAFFWSKWRDSNSRPPVPETGALPTALHLEGKTLSSEIFRGVLHDDFSHYIIIP